MTFHFVILYHCYVFLLRVSNIKLLVILFIALVTTLCSVLCSVLKETLQKNDKNLMIWGGFMTFVLGVYLLLSSGDFSFLLVTGQYMTEITLFYDEKTLFL